MSKMVVLGITLVLLLASLPLISIGTTQGNASLWWAGFGLLALSSLVPPATRFVFDDGDSDDAGEDEGAGDSRDEDDDSRDEDDDSRDEDDDSRDEDDGDSRDEDRRDAQRGGAREGTDDQLGDRQDADDRGRAQPRPAPAELKARAHEERAAAHRERAMAHEEKAAADMQRARDAERKQRGDLPGTNESGTSEEGPQ